MSEIDDSIDSGDVRGMLRHWAKSEIAEAEGRYCQCETPDLTGRKSYLCFACGLKNLARKAEIEAAMQASHPYEVNDRYHVLLRDSCCDFCAFSRADARHAVSQEPEASSDA